MMLGTFSAHLVMGQCQCLVPSHEGWGYIGCDFTSPRKKCKLLLSVPRCSLSNEIFGKHLILLSPKAKGKSAAYPLVLASKHGKNDHEKSSCKPYNPDEKLKSTLYSAEKNVSPEYVDAKPVDSSSSSKEEVSKHDPSSPSWEVAIKKPVHQQGNLLDRLKGVQLHVLALEQWNASRLRKCHRDYFASATNLIHYVALQSLDVQQLKEDLSSVGLLNLETINAYVLASVTAGIQLLENLSSNHGSTRENIVLPSSMIDNSSVINPISQQEGLRYKQREIKDELSLHEMKRRASLHAEKLLGLHPDGRPVHIMVTVGQEAMQNENLISDLLKAGTTVIRINCAHDDSNVWREIIRRVKNCSQLLEKPCRVIMDLAGPKLRTGPLETGPHVMKIAPKRDGKGAVLYPAHVWLSYPGARPPSHLSPDAVLFVDNKEWLRNLNVGDILRFTDTRGKVRTLKISEKFPVFSDVGCLAEISKTSYIESGTELHIKGRKNKLGCGRVVDVPAVQQFVRLRVGDLLLISRDSSLKSNDYKRSSIGTARITCSCGRLFDSVEPGEVIKFDDGKIQGIIRGVSMSEICVSITHAAPKGSKLGSEKSINIPESNMQFEGLTVKDLVDLEFVAANADMVGVSFANDVRDIVMLQRELEKRKLGNLGIVLKIETQGGFEKLPLLLLQAMQSPNPLGVMIARGDLAVECGWEKLADMQEEILSICNAAHIPAIWATQVLETLVKSGLPTRAEITDVAAARRHNDFFLENGRTVDLCLFTHQSRHNTAYRWEQLEHQTACGYKIYCVTIICASKQGL
ncbi:hypothetical protein AMTRI_Chr01g131720 [Amborella trichopoda]